MSSDLVTLALLMGLATYPFRAVPLLAPGFERLPERVRLYLRLVGPSVLAALAAVNVMVATSGDRSAFVVGLPWLSVLACVVLVARRQSLFVGLAAAVAVAIVGRVAGLP